MTTSTTDYTAELVTAKPHAAPAGQTLVEWTLLLTLIGLTCIASLSQLGMGINATLSSVNDGLMGNNGIGNFGAGFGGNGTPPPTPIDPIADPNGDPGEQNANIGAPLNYPS
jgi:Flp pilus assembly pilin Flp